MSKNYNLKKIHKMEQKTQGIIQLKVRLWLRLNHDICYYCTVLDCCE